MGAWRRRWPTPRPTGSTRSAAPPGPPALGSWPRAGRSKSCARPSATSGSTTTRCAASGSGCCGWEWCGRWSPRSCAASPGGSTRSWCWTRSGPSSSCSCATSSTAGPAPPGWWARPTSGAAGWFPPTASSAPTGSRPSWPTGSALECSEARWGPCRWRWRPALPSSRLRPVPGRRRWPGRRTGAAAAPTTAPPWCPTARSWGPGWAATPWPCGSTTGPRSCTRWAARAPPG